MNKNLESILAFAAVKISTLRGVSSRLYLFPTIFAWMTGLSQADTPHPTHPNVDTWCIGRYLIDLPIGSRVEIEYTTKDAHVRTLTGISIEQFRDTVARRHQVLSETPHNNGGFMFVDIDSMRDDYTTLISWNSTDSKRIYTYETFHYMAQQQVLYVFSGRGTAGEEQRKKASAVQRSSYAELRYRAPMEVPIETGFCINEGLIKTDKPNREAYTAVVRLSGHPDVVIALESHVTSRPSDISQQPAIPFSLSVSHYMQTKILRKRPRKVGEAQGQEYLTRSRQKNGKRHYHFEWKTYGIKNSLYYPYMRLTLQTEESDHSISNDKEALRLWENILRSLRLRPTV